MKLEALLYNKKNDTLNCLYFNDNVYYGYSISNKGYEQINKNILLEISKIISFNDACKYLEDYKDYKVYYDKDNNLKHFIKDGKENLELFLKFNTSDGLVYKKEKNQYYGDLVQPKKLKLKDWTIIVTQSVLVTLIVVGGLFAMYGMDAIKVLDTSISTMTYDIVDKVNLNINKIDKTEAITLIYESKYLSQELKEKFANEDLFNDVFPYYENTIMEYFLRDKLTNLCVDQYGKSNPNYYGDAIAYYNYLEPNVLHDKEDDIDFSVSAGHEFVHLLQNPYLELDYIVEATASILHIEYFNIPDGAYARGVKNIRLLMDVIGPKIIFQYIFSGDIAPLDSVLKTNLSEEDYDRIMYLFQYDSSDLSEEENKEIENIIGRLYYKINKKNIKEDLNIYLPDGTFLDNRTYFNTRLMQEKEHYSLTKEYAIKLGFVEENLFYVKKVPDDMLEEYMIREDIIVHEYSIFHNCERIFYDGKNVKLKLKDESMMVMSEEEAQAQGYMTVENVIFVKEEELQDYAFLEDIPAQPFKQITFKSDNISFSADASDEYPVAIAIDSLATRFPKEMVNTITTSNRTIM